MPESKMTFENNKDIILSLFTHEKNVSDNVIKSYFEDNLRAKDYIGKQFTLSDIFFEALVLTDRKIINFIKYKNLEFNPDTKSLQFKNPKGLTQDEIKEELYMQFNKKSNELIEIASKIKSLLINKIDKLAVLNRNKGSNFFGKNAFNVPDDSINQDINKEIQRINRLNP